jgi:hypothetical protein
MKRAWLAAACGAAFGLLALGCGSLGMSGGSDYEIGPGEVTGQLIVNAPNVSIRLSRPGQSQPDGQAMLHVPGSFALFKPQSTFFTRSLQQPGPYREVVEVPGVPLEVPGRCVLPFAFTELPLGTYRLGFYWTEGGDFDIPTVLYFHKELPVTLSHSQPNANNVEYTWDQCGDSQHGASASGKLLLSGNPSPQGVHFTLRDVNINATSWLQNIHVPRWGTQLTPTLYGRLFFEFQGVKAGEYETDWYAFPGQWEDYLWQETDDDPAQPPRLNLQLSADQQTSDLTAYTHYYTFPDWSHTQPADYVLRHRGIMQVELHLAGEIDWGRDTLLTAESVPPSSNPNYSAWNYIAEEHFDEDGIAIYRLSCLHDGDYRLSLVQLGETNDEPITVLDQRSDLVTLIYPHSEPIPYEIWQSDAPYAEVTWAPELDD